MSPENIWRSLFQPRDYQVQWPGFWLANSVQALGRVRWNGKSAQGFGPWGISRGDKKRADSIPILKAGRNCWWNECECEEKETSRMSLDFFFPLRKHMLSLGRSKIRHSLASRKQSVLWHRGHSQHLLLLHSFQPLMEIIVCLPSSLNCVLHRNRN